MAALISNNGRLSTVMADPHHLDAGPDLSFHSEAYPDADADPIFHFDADTSDCSH
jgi:hypothetical protein